MRSVLPCLFASMALLAQTPAHPEFEVASIRPSVPSGMGQVNVGVHIDGAMVRCTYLSLKEYIGMAYSVKLHQVIGPEWLASERFDIAARVPPGSPRDQIAPMLRALLAERFHMEMHRDQKDLPVYALVVKGPVKLKELPPDSTPDGGEGGVNVAATGGRAGVSVNLGNGSSFTFADNRFEAKKVTMASFADTLARFMDRPVVDMTELKGSYDVALNLTAEDYRAMQIRSAIVAGVSLPPEVRRFAEGSDDSLHAALQALGLKLDSRKASTAVLVIDRMDKSPTEN